MFSILKSWFSSSNQSERKKAIQTADCLIDVRSAAEFASGSVKGAINIPLPALRDQMDALRGRKQIVVFCQSGGRSASAAAMLKRAGISQTVNGGSLRNVKKLRSE